ncbi:MAG: alanine dehydrogenase [Firmicutes bacterium]|nr:alanine dehydrogenase [Bacillota bacterium]
MIIGVPKEIKDNENRVALTPAGAEELTGLGHQVIVESGAGRGSGILDEEYEIAGAELVATAADLYGAVEMILKVKEPLPCEYGYLRLGHILCTYLHLVAEPELTRALLERQVTAIAYETIQLANGSLPLLKPMSEVAGRMAVQVGAKYLEKIHGGRGVLLGGVPGVPAAEVVILGGGMVGSNAARIALGMGAHVTIVEKDPERLRYLSDIFHGNVTLVMSNRYNIERAVGYADLLIGAVLIPGSRSPLLVTEEMVMAMKPGSVIVDIDVDQGGCVETVDRRTTHSDPVYVKYDVLHYSVGNVAAAVPRTSTFALTNATLPYIIEIAEKGVRRAVLDNEALAKGVNAIAGNVVYRAIAEALGLPFTPLEEMWIGQ